VSDQNEYLEELTKVNNELANVSRELAKKNAELERTRKIEIERARLLEGQTFAGAIAHMINNIMTRISLSIDILESRQNLDDDGKSRIELVRNEIHRSSDLIDRLLLVTHLDNESSEPFELDAVVRNVIESLDSHLDDITADLCTGGFVANADKNLIRIALSEVLTNAIEASAEGEIGPVFVETRPAPGDSALLLEVADKGPGISDDIADRVFLPFVTSKFLGRGLGLALAKHAVKACGGDISWRRSDDTTTFIISIPSVPRQVGSI